MEFVNFFTLHPNTQTFQRQLTSTKFDCIEFFTETYFFFAVAFGICRLSVKKCLVNTNPALYYHKSQYYQMHGVQSKRTANRSYKLTFFDKIVFSTVGKINFNHRNSIHINVNYSQTLISITLRLSSTHGNRYITLFNWVIKSQLFSISPKSSARLQICCSRRLDADRQKTRHKIRQFLTTKNSNSSEKKTVKISRKQVTRCVYCAINYVFELRNNSTASTNDWELTK